MFQRDADAFMLYVCRHELGVLGSASVLDLARGSEVGGGSHQAACRGNEPLSIPQVYTNRFQLHRQDLVRP